MFDPHTDPPALSEFELICATLEDYEHLPELAPGPVERPRPIDGRRQEDTLDAEILAGLVSP